MSTEATAQTTTAEAGTPAPVVKPTIQQELAAAFADARKPADPAIVAGNAEAVGAGKPEGQTAETATTTETVEAVAEPAKPVEKPTSLARRLALVAQAERARKETEAAAAARDKEIAPLVERINKAKTASTKMEAAATVLGLDEDGIAELYLELHKHHAEAGDPKKPVDPMANLAETVSKLLDTKLKERDETHKAQQAKDLDTQRAAYVAEATECLDARGDEFPLVAIAPPSQVDITAISEAWLVANGEIPEPETVLKLIQDQRQKALDERSARKAKVGAAPEKKTEGTTAPATAGETSGSKAKPSRNDVALVPPRKLSIAEEFTEAYRVANPGA